jgi:hypothetical protein
MSRVRRDAEERHGFPGRSDRSGAWPTASGAWMARCGASRG